MRGQTEPGLVGFYDIGQETERFYSFNPGACTGHRILIWTHMPACCLLRGRGKISSSAAVTLVLTVHTYTRGRDGQAELARVAGCSPRRSLFSGFDVRGTSLTVPVKSSAVPLYTPKRQPILRARMSAVSFLAAQIKHC